MAQHDYVIANGTGAAVRSDLNNALAAIVSQNSGATEPATTYAFQFWADTTTNLLKLRNSANNAWVTLFQLDGEWSTLPVENGTAAAPSIYFKDSGTDTGFYSPGTDQVGISTGGTGRLFINSSGSVGIGTSTVGDTLHVKGSSTYGGVIVDNSATTGGGAFRAYRNGVQKAIFCADSWVAGTSSDDAAIYADAGGGIKFYTNNSSTAKAVLTSGGSLGIGTTPAAWSGFTALEVSEASIVSSGSGDAFFSANAYYDGSWKYKDAGVARNIYMNADGIVFRQASSGSANAGITWTEQARLDTSGRLLVGTSTSPSIGDSQYSLISILGSTAGSTTDAYFSLRRGQAPASIASGSGLGTIVFGANDGSPYAAIIGQTDGTGGSGDYPGRLVFSTTADGASSPTERAKITSGGYSKFTSDGTYQSTTSYHEFNNNTTNAEVLYIRNATATGPYGITIRYSAASPNGTASEFLYCQDTTVARATIRSNGGIANFQANNVNLSDINTKKDISPAAGTWDCIKEWEIVNYRYKDQSDDADLNLGVIAQQVAESCPEVITVFSEAKDAKPAVLDDDGNEVEPAQEAQPEKLGIKEQQMYWMAIKALQEAQVRIEALEAEVAALKAQ